MSSGCISLLLSRLPKLSGPCYLDGPGNLGSLGGNKEISAVTTNGHQWTLYNQEWCRLAVQMLNLVCEPP